MLLEWRIAQFLLVMLLALSFISLSFSQSEDINEKERAYQIALKDERVQDLLMNFPNLRLEGHYSDEYSIWIFEFLYGDWGEAGLVTVSLDKGEVLEFDFHIEKLKEWQSGKRESIQEEMGHEGWNEFLFRLLPQFEGATLAWFSLLMVLLVMGNFQQPFSIQNLDIILLYSLCPFLLWHWSNPKAAYTGLFVITFFLFLRCIYQCWKIKRPPIRLTIESRRVLVFLILVSVLLHIQTVYQKGIGDAGLWSAIGAEYIKHTGQLPYGTEFGANCIYGPLMYVSFIPASYLFTPELSIENGMVDFGSYEGFEMRGVQSSVLFFDLLTFIAVYLLAKRWCDVKTALALVVIYAYSPYMLGIIGEIGIERASHVVGTPFILFAILLIRVPILSGLLLGWACGMVYYPVFLFPLYLGSVWKNQGVSKAVLFLVSFAIIGLICLMVIQLMTVPSGEDSPLMAFLEDSILQQQFKEGYGDSELSFWGQYPTIAKWGKPLVGLLYILFCGGLLFFPKSIQQERLAALTAVVLIGTQLVLSFGGGTYIGFYLAPLILVLFCPFQNDSEMLE